MSDDDNSRELLLRALNEATKDMDHSNEKKCCLVLSQSKPNLKILANSAEYALGNEGVELAAGLGIKNYFVKNVVSACSTGIHSLYSAIKSIETGCCDFAVVGVSESSINKFYQSAFKNMGVLTRSVVRPFDKKRDGFAIGEGAGVIVIEKSSDAVKRGAEIKAHIKACRAAISENIINLSSSSSNITDLITGTVNDSGVEKIDYINAHGTATKFNDGVEAESIKKAFGRSAGGINISSTKAATGHLLGASGIVELIYCILAIEHGVVPPTLNLDEPEYDLNFTPKKSVYKEIKNAMSLSYGFGGQIGAVICGK